MIDGNSAAEREYQRQQDKHDDLFDQQLDIAACDAYSDPSSEYVIDALNNDDRVRLAWARLVNCHTDDSQEVLASCAREFISSIESYAKSCPDIVSKAERLSK